ncbi:MAG TPA: plastocyanin/azurin family copper-binding protein [Magnetospirillum sp.]|jgi:plastocyanin|nr:plastocyanin/azurin family copper-binding protein [Magnetospirillum sp.]
MERLLLAGLVLPLLALPAWGQEVVRVVIDTYRFQPQAVTVKPGTVVEWVNQEKRTSHSVLLDGHPESDRLFPGETFRWRFDTPGVYPYHCGPHPEMTGTVEVTR